MRVEIKAEHPEDIRVTLTCTMTVGQWRKLGESLSEQPYHSDANVFSRAIRKTVEHIGGHFDSGTNFSENEGSL